jgi:hypothetical protein
MANPAKNTDKKIGLTQTSGIMRFIKSGNSVLDLNKSRD